MITITATKTYNTKSFLKDVVLFIAIILIIHCIAAFIQQRSLDSYSWYLPIFFSITYVYGLLDQRRLLTIVFDGVSQQIIIQYKTLLSKPAEKKIPLERALLEAIYAKSKPHPTAIYFLRGKTEIYEIKSKAELTQQQLTAIVDAASRLNIPIEKL